METTRLSAELFDPDEEMPTQENDLRDLETKVSWVNYTLMQQRLPPINAEGDSSVIATVHPLLKRLVAANQQLQTQQKNFSDSQCARRQSNNKRELTLLQA